MLTTLIVTLAGVALYLGKQLLDSRTEAAQLRSKVEHLKRRLSKAGH